MKTSFKNLEGMELQARDGAIGTVKDLLIDDHHWVVRYLVVSTGHWLPGRRVLIAANELESYVADKKYLAVDLSQDEIRNSPEAASRSELSREYETDLHRHYGWAAYWAEPGVSGGQLISPAAAPTAAAVRDMFTSERPVENAGADGVMADERAAEKRPLLRSAHELCRYHVEAKDGPIGHVADFGIEVRGWSVPTFVVDAHLWWPGEEAFVGTGHILEIDSENKKLWLSLTREAVKGGPRTT
ncbi:MAG: PRC-barrel domain-containing protein [Opitutaceae bacterium]